jgi:hypothetical protein
MTLSAKYGVRLTRNRNCFSPTELHIACRHRSRAARRGVDQRHLAEDIVVGQRAEQAIAEADVDLAALNDKELRRCIAFLENHFAGLVFAHRGAGSRQNAEIDGCIGHVAPPRRSLDYCSFMTARDYSFMTPSRPVGWLVGRPNTRHRLHHAILHAEGSARINASLKMLTATNDKVRVHPASPVETVAVPQRSLGRHQRYVRLDRRSAAVMQDYSPEILDMPIMLRYH